MLLTQQNILALITNYPPVGDLSPSVGEFIPRNMAVNKPMSTFAKKYACPLPHYTC
jgi:hypothetical protein